MVNTLFFDPAFYAGFTFCIFVSYLRQQLFVPSLLLSPSTGSRRGLLDRVAVFVVLVIELVHSVAEQTAVLVLSLVLRLQLSLLLARPCENSSYCH